MCPMGWYGWGAAVVAGVSACVGLHRLALTLEERGWIYYMKRSPSGGASCFSALQEAIEPQARHVVHVDEERRPTDEDDTPGGDAGWSRPLWPSDS